MSGAYTRLQYRGNVASYSAIHAPNILSDPGRMQRARRHSWRCFSAIRPRPWHHGVAVVIEPFEEQNA